MAKAPDRVSADLIAEALEARRDELISRGVAEIRERMQTYRRADQALIEDVTRHIAEHHDLLCAVLRRGRPAAPMGTARGAERQRAPVAPGPAREGVSTGGITTPRARGG